MSQFQAQAAFLPANQGARRNAPVDVPSGTGIPAVQVAGIGAPGLPGVAVLPAPVPDLSAARDLEQALRATQALGNTLVDVGNALNIQRQIDERQSIYDARLRAEQDEGRMLVDFQDGKMDAMIDATDDIDAFIGHYQGQYVDPARTQPAGPGDQLTAAEVEYRERIGKPAQQMYVRRRADQQKLKFARDARGVHAELVDPTSVGPSRDSETLWNEFSERYPWLDRATFTEATFGKALEALARSGDEAGFAQASALVTGGEDRTIVVEPLRKVLSDAVRARRASQLSMADLAMKEATSSASPFLGRYATLRDSLDSSVEDPGLRESTMIDFLTEEIKQTRSEGDLAASDAVAKMHLSPEGYAEFSRRKEALAAPVLTKVLKAYASDPDADFASYAESVAGRIDPDDLQTAYDARVRTVKEHRKSLMITEYLRTGDRARLEAMLDESFDRYDTARPEWSQIDENISGEEFNDLLDELDKIDEDRAQTAAAADIMARRVVLQPGDTKWDTVMAKAGAMRGGKIIDPQKAGELIVGTQTVPAKMLDAIYADLRGTGPERRRAIELLAEIAPLLEDPAAAAQINGFSLRDSDAGTNAATIRAIESVLPSLARMQRGQDGRLSDGDIQASAEAFNAALERWQDAQPPAIDARRYEDSLRANGILKIGGVNTFDPQTGLPSFPVYRNALKTAAATKLSRNGLPNEAAVELADVVASDVIAESYPAIGNVGMSKQVLEQKLEDRVSATVASYHLPTIGGRGFTSPVPRLAAPNASWDEARAVAMLKEKGVESDAVTHVFPSLGDGNSWYVLSRDKKGTMNYVQIDLGRPAVAAPLTVEQRIQQARERRAASKSKPASWIDAMGVNLGR
jgi:hypothetical protein